MKNYVINDRDRFYLLQILDPEYFQSVYFKYSHSTIKLRCDLADILFLFKNKDLSKVIDYFNSELVYQNLI